MTFSYTADAQSLRSSEVKLAMNENGTVPESPFGDQLASIEQWVRNAPAPLIGGGLMLLIGFLLVAIAGGALPWFLFLAGLVVTTTSSSKHYNIGFLRTVGSEQVIDQWDMLIGNAQEKAEEILEGTVASVEASTAPNILMERREIAPSLLRGVLGGRRSFLVVQYEGHSNLKPFRMYVNARAYGNNLQVSWYVVEQPGFWQRMLNLFGMIPLVNLLFLPFQFTSKSKLKGQSGMLGLDFFDLQDLTAYVTNVHHCLIESVERVIQELNQDPSRIERKSRGFLGIS